MSPVTREFSVEDPTKIGHARIDLNSDADPEFLSWCDSLGLYWIVGGYFYTPAMCDWSPHIDGHVMMDFCKVNWCTGGGQNSMKWYTPKENFELVPKTQVPRSVDSKYSMIDPDQIELAYQTVHAENCLINAGRIHSFDSGSCAQHVVSIVLGRKKTNKVVMWHEVLEVFADYINETKHK